MKPLRIDGRTLSDVLPGHTDPVGATGPAGDMPTLRLAEVLGVEVGQKFVVKTSCGMSEEFVLGSDEYVRKSKDGIIADGSLLCRAINHPESVVRLPRLTEPEIERCRVYGAKWVSRDTNCDDGSVDLWREKPSYANGMYDTTTGVIATVYDADLFPGVKPGDCIGLEEIQ